MLTRTPTLAVFSDYVSCILGLVRQGSNWTLDPFGVCALVTLVILTPRFVDRRGFFRISKTKITRRSNGVKEMCVVWRCVVYSVRFILRTGH